jgi:hypothetical protein
MLIGPAGAACTVGAARNAAPPATAAATNIERSIGSLLFYPGTNRNDKSAAEFRSLPSLSIEDVLHKYFKLNPSGMPRPFEWIMDKDHLLPS